MTPQNYQERTGEKARPYPISMYQSTVDLLDEIHQETGESQGAIVRRLAKEEVERIRRAGVPTCEVLTFPSYNATSDPIPTTVLFRRDGVTEQRINAVGERLRPGLPKNSFVLIRRAAREGGDLSGQLVDVRMIDDDGRPHLILTVDSLDRDTATSSMRYREWIEAIFSGVGAELGMRFPADGSDRSIGRYRLTHTGPLSEKGDVGWSALYRTSFGWAIKRLPPRPWRQTPEGSVVAQVVAAIHRMEQSDRLEGRG